MWETWSQYLSYPAPNPCHAIVALSVLCQFLLFWIVEVLGLNSGALCMLEKHRTLNSILSFFTSKGRTGRTPALPCHMDQGCAWIVK